ncbi:DUF3987 domain-containing protein [Cyanobacterium sp. HL-69]|uniref:DUF3987 domain-containing protein n=1 Tax=Cyanobacterium sp. HL-69 TaxID=2054282 RepID=UPI00406BC844
MTYDNAFKIGEHIDLFTPTTTKGKYICPICGGDDFSISKDGQKYNCYNSGGECNKEIFKWVGERKGLSIHKAKKDEIKTYSPPKDPIVIATTVDYKSPVTEMIAEYENEASLKKYAMWLNYPGGNKVKRVLTTKRKDGKEKREKNFYGYENGSDKSKITKIWEPYHLELFSQATGKWILKTEGEKACDYALDKGLISTCILGSKATDIDHIIRLCERVKQYQIKGIIYITDNDKQGLDKAIKTRDIVASQGIPFIIFPISYLFPEVPEHGDFEEYSKHTKLSPEAIKTNIELTVGANLEELLNIDNSIVTTDLQGKLNATYNRHGIGENDFPSIMRQFIDEFSKPIYTEAGYRGKIAEFCSQYPIQATMLEKAIKARKELDNQIIDIEELSPRVDDLLKIPHESLDLKRVLGVLYGSMLEQEALNLPTNPMALFTILLPVIGGAIGTRRSVVLQDNPKYRQPCILRTAIVADSGKKKTPTTMTIIKPLKDKNLEAYKQYKDELREYQENELLPKDARANLPEPKMIRYMVKDSTIDGLLLAHQENPKGFLCFCDELSGYFERQNKFYSGDDVARELELYDGGQVIKTRANKDSNIFIEKTAISVTGTIQWSALEKIFNNGDDSRGISARWFFWGGELPKEYLPDHFVDSGLSELLGHVIDEITKLDETDLIVPSEVYPIFKNAQRKLIDIKETLPTEQLRAKYSKGEGAILRVAGILHTWHYILNTELAPPSPLIITEEIMKLAIEVVFYYLRQFEYVAIKCQKNFMDARLVKILELVAKKGEVTASNIRMFIRDFKDTPATEIDELLLLLIENDKLVRIPTKRGVKVKIK